MNEGHLLPGAWGPGVWGGVQTGPPLQAQALGDMRSLPTEVPLGSAPEEPSSPSLPPIPRKDTAPLSSSGAPQRHRRTFSSPLGLCWGPWRVAAALVSALNFCLSLPRCARVTILGWGGARFCVNPCALSTRNWENTLSFTFNLLLTVGVSPRLTTHHPPEAVPLPFSFDRKRTQ